MKISYNLVGHGQFSRGNREFWNFVACREFKRSVAKAYPENWNTYVVVDPIKQLKVNYTKNTFINSLKEKQKKDLKNYNEFDL